MSELSGPPPATPPEPVIVTLRFDAADASALGSVLARYVVVSRGHSGCTNIDLCASDTVEGRFLVIEKWSDDESRRIHFDSDDMVTMAQACRGLLRSPAEIDLHQPISAHDLA
ncbi:MAG TPA: antibiotic biosynthesis monooxygenase [Microthrixaceae bacterium]|nr:antibiotic biosynthesis monooxygenase [Microthrixaceae bacterium]